MKWLLFLLFGGKNIVDINSSAEPLCVFCLSPPFSIRGVSGENRTLAPSGRQQFSFSTSSIAGIPIGCLNRKKTYTNLLLTIADLFANFKKRKPVKLDDILSTIQDAWQGPEHINSGDLGIDMERLTKKYSVQETSSPSPIRRRLSVPETIMRKHNLAQERLTSQQSIPFYRDTETQCSSDPTLSRKNDSHLIRKPTLLRRLWSENTKSKISGSYQEWKHSYKKLSSTQSLNSNHSSPEHTYKTSPQKKLSSNSTRFSTRHSSTPNSPKRKLSFIENPALKALSNTPYSRGSTTKYTFSSFTNYSDSNSNSAYTNSISNVTNTASSTLDNTKHSNHETLQRSDSQSRLSTVSLQESAVQTSDVANLNVISNVNLSQSTLDVIYKEVMKDVSKLSSGEINISSATVTCNDNDKITVEKAPDVSFDTHSDTTQLFSERQNLEQFILSKIRTGSPYSKFIENTAPAVPRFSAVPQTFSMEVNTSEEDKEESDSASFVDSLEDFSSPRPNIQSRQSSTDISQLLPEGKKDNVLKKSSAFFIPIEKSREKEVKSVSELLPLKVKERLNERQQKREEKFKQFKSALKTTDSISEIKSNLGQKKYLPKKRTKPILPGIELIRKSAKVKRPEPSKPVTINKKTSRPIKTKGLSVDEDNKKIDILKETATNHNKSTNINTRKKIEILEIMEYIDISSEKNTKSKIPVPTGNNPVKKIYVDRPAYLDLDNHVPDHKLDQLVANILIDSLNHDVIVNDEKNANILEPTPSRNHGKYFQKFVAIPEETSALRRSPEKHNNNVNNNSDCAEKGRRENNSLPLKNKNFEKKKVNATPKGWLTVYSIHKDAETPESTSDEGKSYLDTNGAKEVSHQSANAESANVVDHYQLNKNHTINEESPPEYKNDDLFSSVSSEDERNTFESAFFREHMENFKNYQRKLKARRKKQKSDKEDWSVTVSGTSKFGQMAPDVQMRLKFSNKLGPSNQQNYSGSAFDRKERNEKQCNFPKISENNRNTHQIQNKIQKRPIDESLPNIRAAQNGNRKKKDSLVSVTPSIIMPRQTKTSRSRYHLSRPRERFSLPDVPSMINERQYYEILRHIPNILAVTGRSISSDTKSFDER